jgi:hypothetical protein
MIRSQHPLRIVIQPLNDLGTTVGLPMIITVNATVCVIGTRVSDQRFMIICSRWGRSVPEGDKAAMNSG